MPKSAPEVISRTSPEDIVRVRRYYQRTQIFYDLFWKEPRTLSMNYGLWKNGTKTRAEAFLHQNKAILRGLRVKPGDRVLEAGCGTGGTSIWLAREGNCHVVGITLVSQQAGAAQRCTIERGLRTRARFIVMDFLATAFPAGAFDAVFASESVCYARDKRAFAREAFRVLKPGGRLVVMDGFLSRTDLSPLERSIFDEWRAGWAVPDLVTPREMSELITDVGFETVCFHDLTVEIAGAVKRIFAMGVLGYPFLRLAGWLGLVTSVEIGNAVSSIRQRWLFRHGLGVFGMFEATKPITQPSGSSAAVR